MHENPWTIYQKNKSLGKYFRYFRTEERHEFIKEQEKEKPENEQKVEAIWLKEFEKIRRQQGFEVFVLERWKRKEKLVQFISKIFNIAKDWGKTYISYSRKTSSLGSLMAEFWKVRMKIYWSEI